MKLATRASMSASGAGTGVRYAYPLRIRKSMPLAGGTCRCRVLYWESEAIANSYSVASHGRRACGQWTPSWNQNMESSYSRRPSLKSDE